MNPSATLITAPRSQRLTIVAVILLTGCLLIAAHGMVVGAATIGVSYSPELGSYLVGDDMMTLYLFTPDEPDKSTCYGACADIWPPFIIDSLDDLAVPGELAGDFGLTERTDGSMQVTYNGMPLYYWVVDKQPGDVTGQGVNDIWYVVNPSPTVQGRDHPVHGKILVNAQGMTLYVFAKDTENVSNCSGGCDINWPPLIVSYGEPTKGEGISGELGLITREDGAQQVTYEGAPLYGWINDRNPGDMTGHGVGGNWFVVNP